MSTSERSIIRRTYVQTTLKDNTNNTKFYVVDLFSRPTTRFYDITKYLLLSMLNRKWRRRRSRFVSIGNFNKIVFQRIFLLWCILFLFLCIEVSNFVSVSATSTSNSETTANNLPRSSSTTKSAIPRSSHHHRRRSTTITRTQGTSNGNDGHNNDSTNTGSPASSIQLLQPPWNPSPSIDQYGFLSGLYQRLPGEWEKEYDNTNGYFSGGSSIVMNVIGGIIGPFLRWRGGDGATAVSNIYGHNSVRNELQVPVKIRQVPGDGNCLFHSISLCLYHAVNGTHWDISGGNCHDTNNIPYEDLYYHSQQLRKAAVVCLSQSIDRKQQQPINSGKKHQKSSSNHNNHQQDAISRYIHIHNNHRHNKMLYLQGREYLSASELVHAAASQYGLTPEEYCDSMEQEYVWGGGPEIVALSNVLKRPIHVYELTTTRQEDSEERILTATSTSTSRKRTDSTSLSSTFHTTNQNNNNQHNHNNNMPTFALRRMACFGSPRFDRTNKPLHILSADSRFPDIQPGQQLSAGNHFLAVFPINDHDTIVDEATGEVVVRVTCSNPTNDTNNNHHSTNNKQKTIKSLSNSMNTDSDDNKEPNQISRYRKEKLWIRGGLALNFRRRLFVRNVETNRITSNIQRDVDVDTEYTNRIQKNDVRWTGWFQVVMNRILRMSA